MRLPHRLPPHRSLAIPRDLRANLIVVAAALAAVLLGTIMLDCWLRLTHPIRPAACGGAADWERGDWRAGSPPPPVPHRVEALFGSARP